MRRQQLPPLENVLLTSLLLECERDEKGPEWCAQHRVGAMRRKLGTTLGDRSDFARTHDAHVWLLTLTCMECRFRDCAMKIWSPPQPAIRPSDADDAA